MFICINFHLPGRQLYRNAYLAPSVLQRAVQSNRNHEAPAEGHCQALRVKYASETLGVFLGSPFPATEGKLTNFGSKLEMLLIAVEKGSFEVSREMKANEFSLVAG